MRDAESRDASTGPGWPRVPAAGSRRKRHRLPPGVPFLFLEKKSGTPERVRSPSRLGLPPTPAAPWLLRAHEDDLPTPESAWRSASRHNSVKSRASNSGGLSRQGSAPGPLLALPATSTEDRRGPRLRTSPSLRWLFTIFHYGNGFETLVFL